MMTVSWLNKVSDVLNSLMKALGIAALVIVVIASFLQVFTRYVLNNSLFWTEECARFAFIWATMCGTSVGVKSGAHAAVDFLVARLKGRWGLASRMLIDLLILAVSVQLCHSGVVLAGMVARQLSPALHLPMSYVYGAVPIASAATCVHVIANIATRAAAFRRGSEVRPNQG